MINKLKKRKNVRYSVQAVELFLIN